MANTVIQLKKSATPSVAPSSLAFGELAINYADGILYYKASNGMISSISTGGYSFGTVNANGTLVISDTYSDVLDLVPGQNITITGDAINDRITIGANLTAANNWANTVGNSVNTITSATYATITNLNSNWLVTNAAFAKANAALANTSGVSFAGDLFFPTGNVGIGTTSTNNKLEVIGNSYLNGNVTTGLLKHSPVPISKLLTASDAANNDNFSRVSLSGDASVLAVSSPFWEGTTGTDRGGVYIYDWNGSAWIQRGSVLEAADAADSDSFGYVALSSNGSILAVAAESWEGATGSNRGGVYIYDWNGSAWIQRGSVLEAADAANSDSFGSGVSLSSNGSILAVGARFWEGATGTDRGGVYIYDWNGSAWIQRGSVLQSADAANSDQFGYRVALSSNGSILAVAAPGSVIPNKFYIFDWNGSSWIQRSSTVPFPSGISTFGLDLDISSDGSILAVSANPVLGPNFQPTPDSDNRGVVYIYDWNGSSWIQRGSRLISADASPNDNFYGCSLSDDGSILVVGAEQWEGVTGTGRGAVYTYTLTGALPSYTGESTGSGWIEGSNSSLIARTAGLDRVTIDSNGVVNVAGPTLLVAGQNVLSLISTVGASSNAYSNTVGTAGNNYTNTVGAASNNYASILAANNAIGANNWANTKLANTSGVSFAGDLYFPTGNVGIGTSSPSSKLQVNGTVTIANTGPVESFRSGANTITLNMYNEANGTLSWEGSAGQLFSITNDLSGSLFTVNDVSGIPSIEVDALGNVDLAPFGGNVGIGTSNPVYKLDVQGDARITGNLILGDATTDTVTINAANFNLANNVSFDSGTLFIDSQNNRVGISTTSPISPLTVGGSASILGTTLNIGDGTTSWITNSIVFKDHADGQYWGYINKYGLDSTPQNTLELYLPGINYTSAIRLRTGQAGSVQFWTNETERMRITSGGNVGIGTSAPSSRLHISKAGTGDEFIIGDLATNYVKIGGIGSGTSYLRSFESSFDINNPFTNGNLLFSTAGSERLRITSVGDIGVGTSSPETYKSGNAANSRALIVKGACNNNTEYGSITLVGYAGGGGVAGSVDFFAHGYNIVSAIRPIMVGGGNSADLGFYTASGGVLTKNMYLTSSGKLITNQITAYDNFYAAEGTPLILSNYSTGVGTNIKLKFQGSDGSGGTPESGYIKSIRTAITSSTVTCDLSFAVTNNSNTSYEVVRFKSDGNIGIGTTSPSARLHANTSAGTVAQFTGGSDSGVIFAAGGLVGFTDPAGNNGFIFNSTSNYAYAQTNGSERMRITSTGNVGIGTSSPSANLHVVGSVLIYPNSLNATSRLRTRSVHADGRWAIDMNANGTDAKLAQIYSGTIGLGTGSFSSGALDTAIGFADDFAYIPKLRIGGINSGPANISYISITANNTSEWNYGNSYPDGNNYYQIRTSLESGGGAQRAPLLIGAKYLYFATGATDNERMRIDANGNVGIGTTAPQTLLDVAGSDNNGIQYRTATRWISIGSSGGLSTVASGSGTEMVFSVGSERMRINANGNVGIGTTAPGGKLTVAQPSGTYTSNAPFFSSLYDNTQHFNIYMDGNWNTHLNSIQVSTNQSALAFDTNGSERMRITANGTVGIGTSSPSIFSKLDVNGYGKFGTSAYGFFVGTVGSNAQLDAGPNAITFYAGSTEKMRLTSDGDVLINQTSSLGTGKLGVAGRIAIDVNGSDSFSGQLYLTSPNGWPSNIQAAGPSSNGIAFWTYTGSWSERVRITGAGNVGIGTISPAEKLEVNGNIKANSYIMVNSAMAPITVITATTTDQIVDSFTTSTWRSAQYNITMTAGTDYHTTQISLIHDGTNAYITEYGTLSTANNLGTFSATVSGSTVRLNVVPTFANTSINMLRTTNK